MNKVEDVNGVPYSAGSRHYRRKIAFSKPKSIEPIKLSKKVKLPKEQWIKGRSKFLDFRQKENEIINNNKNL